MEQIFKQYIHILGNTNDVIMMVSFFNDILQVYQHYTVNYRRIVTIIQKRHNKFKEESRKVQVLILQQKWFFYQLDGISYLRLFSTTGCPKESVFLLQPLIGTEYSQILIIYDSFSSQTWAILYQRETLIKSQHQT